MEKKTNSLIAQLVDTSWIFHENIYEFFSTCRHWWPLFNCVNTSLLIQMYKHLFFVIGGHFSRLESGISSPRIHDDL